MRKSAVSLIVLLSTGFFLLSCDSPTEIRPSPSSSPVSSGELAFHNLPDSSACVQSAYLQTIQADSSDHIWVLTALDSVSRIYSFDGTAWARLRQIGQWDTSDYFSCLAVTADRKIVIGTNAGLAFQTNDGWSVFSDLFPSDYADDLFIRHVCCTPDHPEGRRIWVSTFSNVFGIYDNGFAGSERTLKTTFFGMISGTTSMATTNDSFVYIASNYGLGRQDEGDWFLDNNNAWADPNISALAGDVERRTLWIAYNSGALVQYYTHTAGLCPFQFYNDEITCMALDSRHTLWVGTWHSGLWRYKDDRMEHVLPYQGLTRIRSLTVDSKDHIWMLSSPFVAEFIPAD